MTSPSHPRQSATPEALANLRADLARTTLRLLAILSGFSVRYRVIWHCLDLWTGHHFCDYPPSNTLFLAFWAAIIAVPLAIFLVWRLQRRWPDKLISGVTLASISIEFLMATF